MKVLWIKCILQSRCRLALINLKNEHFNNLTGVYVIWCGNNVNKIIRVGQGVIRDELMKMKTDETLNRYGPDLFVTWADVPPESLNGVEAFLCSRLKPAVNRNLEFHDFISVNLPDN